MQHADSWVALARCKGKREGVWGANGMEWVVDDDGQVWEVVVQKEEVDVEEVGEEDVLWMGMKGEEKVDGEVEGSTYLDSEGVVENASESASNIEVLEDKQSLKEVRKTRNWRAIFLCGRREKGHEESEGGCLVVRRLRKDARTDAWFHES